MLTRKQYELLTFMHERIKETGIPPSFDEMKEALNLRSKSGIHRLVMALEERGFIRRLPHRARALEVLRLPHATVPAQNHGVIPLHGAPRNGAARRPRDQQGTGAHRDMEGIAVPVMGKIAAGTPIEAIQNNTHDIALPAELIGSGEHYALQVQGDSMLGAGIRDGDTVILRRTDTANSGDIVVALVDGEEATLKRLRSKGASIALEAANPAYETRIFGPGRIKVQGRLVGLLRKY